MRSGIGCMLGRLTDTNFRKPSVKKRKHTCANVFWSFMLNQVRQGLLSFEDLMKQALASLSGGTDGSNGKESGGGIAAIEYNSNSPPAQIVAVQPVFASTDMRVTAMGVGKRLLIVACLCMMLSTFSSCGGSNEPAPPVPPPPPVKVDTVRYVDQTNLDKMLEAVGNMNKDKTYVIWTFQNGVLIPLYANETDAVRLNQLNDLSVIQPSKGVYNPNGAKFIPGNDKIILTDELCAALAKQWQWNNNQGVKFDFNGNNIGFWINSGQSGKFTQEMLQKLFYTDARPVNATNANELDAKCKEALDMAKQGQKVMFTMSGNWNINAKQLIALRLLNHPNIVTVNNATITVTMNEHPTRAYELNSPYYANNGNWVGNKIMLKTMANPKAFKGENTMLPNDTTLRMLNTAATAGKQNYAYNFVDDSGKAANPMVGLWTKWDGNQVSDYEKIIQTVDLQPPEWMDFSAGFDMDTYIGGDGGFKILMEALAKANKGINSPNGRDYYIPFISKVNLNVTQNPKYQGEYDHYYKGQKLWSGKCTNLELEDILRFWYTRQKIPDILNFNLLFTTSSKTKLVLPANGKICFVISNDAGYEISGGNQEITETMIRNYFEKNLRITIEGGTTGSCITDAAQYLGRDGVFYDQVIGNKFPLNVAAMVNGITTSKGYGE